MYCTFRSMMATSVATTALIASAATAQTAGDRSGSDRQGGGDQDIVVTAQRVEQRLQDVPISISVLGGEKLDRSTSRGVMDELARVPGVAMSEGFQTGGAQLAVRGVAAYNNVLQGQSPVAFYIDTVPFAFVKTAITPDLNAYDLERVEVLRGPQGTLFGASASNGVVRVLTHKADLDKTEMKGRASISYTEGGGWNPRVDGAVNLPLVEGALAMRLVAGYQRLSGWIEKANDKNANSGEIVNLRGKISGQPTDRLSFDLSAWISRTHFDAPPNADNSGRSRAVAEEPIDSDFDAFGLRVSYEFPGFTLNSASSYLKLRVDTELDAALAAPNTNILTTNLDARVLAQEVSLVSDRDSNWWWTLGAMYRDAKDASYQLRHTATGAPTGGYVAPVDLTNTSKSYAFFGELTRVLADGAIELTVGGRYFHDRVTVQEHSRLQGDPASYPPGTPQSLPLQTLKNTFKKFSPRVVATWHARPDLTAYASYAEGFRSGSDQNPGTVIINPLIAPTRPDNLKNYEIGAKGDLFDRTLSFDISAYYMKWEDVQLPITVAFGTALLPAILNGPSASGFGVDVGLTVRPARGMNVGFNFSTNDLTTDADVISGGAVIRPKGERLAMSPKYIIGGDVSYEFDIGDRDLTGEFSASVNYTSRRDQFGLQGGLVQIGTSDRIWNAGARFSLRSAAGWTVTAFVDNLLDEDGAPFRAITTQPPVNHREWATRMRPRTFGLQLDLAM